MTSFYTDRPALTFFLGLIRPFGVWAHGVYRAHFRHDAFDVGDGVLKGDKRMQVHSQMSNCHAVNPDALSYLMEAGRLACDMGNTAVESRGGKFIDENDGRICASNRGVSIREAGDLLDNGLGFVGHDEFPLKVTEQALAAVTRVIDQRVAAELGMPHWPSARYFAEEVVQVILEEMRPASR